jgi:Uma2 family endonuclease
MSVTAFRYDVEYPESDGQPMGETDFHRQEMMDLISALEGYFEDAGDVYVSGNLFLYYRKGDPRSVVCPDVFVVKGVDPGPRRIYKLWEEGRAPSFVIEVSSDSTCNEDLGRKKQTYADLGVEEYFLHDPFEEYLSPPLQGFRLKDGEYRRLEPSADGSFQSAETGLILRREGSHLRLVIAATGELLLRMDETRAQAREAEAARREAKTALREAKAAKREADTAKREAERERTARQALEEELARLRQELARRPAS